jgi:hypothetical protein
MNDQQDLKIYIYRRLKELGIPCIHISLSNNATMDNAEDPEDIACNPGIFIFYLNAIQSIMREISLKSWKGGPLLLLRLRRQYKFYLEDEAL